MWLDPVYESPMVDDGYDISDSRSIDPTGTLDDREALRDARHERDVRLASPDVGQHTRPFSPPRSATRGGSSGSAPGRQAPTTPIASGETRSSNEKRYRTTTVVSQATTATPVAFNQPPG